MGFLPISLGVMLLYDLQVALTHPSGEVYAVVDIFPTFLGFVLILWGLVRLSKRGTDCKREITIAGCLTLLSAFVLIKDTALYGYFYSDGIENDVGQCIGFCQHLLILGFLVLLFRKTGSVLASLDEEKLARSHGRMTVFALMEGVVYFLCFALTLTSREGFWDAAYKVTRILDMLLWIILVWFGGIIQLRASLRTN